MELTKVIAELRAERAAIDEALAALDRIARAAAGEAKRKASGMDGCGRDGHGRGIE